MKILHLSTSDIEGGAARAAHRLHTGLNRTKHASNMLVRAKDTQEESIQKDGSWQTKLGPPLNGLPLNLYPKKQPLLFSSQWSPDNLNSAIQTTNPDIVHLHWVCNGFLQIETLSKINQPLVWTFHDMWAMTGGCHVIGDCQSYRNQCGKCPQLGSSSEWDLSRLVWHRKERAWKDLNLTIVSPSQWLADCIRSSSLFSKHSIEVIPHGLDLAKYKPVDKMLSRQLLNLPQDKKLIHFGSGSIKNRNKGFQYLETAIQHLKQRTDLSNWGLVIFGASPSDMCLNLDIETYFLGQFHDDLSLSVVYSSADVVVVPSLQETFGQTASEALACGTPVVAFDSTGLKDVISHKKDGYLAQPFEAQDLSNGIFWILEDPMRCQKLALAARQKAKNEFSLDCQAQHHITLYQRLLEAA